MIVSGISISDLDKIVDEAFNQESIDVVNIKDAILYIHSITKDKKNFEEIYKKIGSKLFENGINLSEYQSDHFITKLSKVKKDEAVLEQIDDFLEKLKKLVLCCQADLEVLNKYVILKLGEDRNKKNSYLLLHDTHSKPHVFAKVKTTYSEDCKIFEVGQFIEELKSSKIDLTQNYIVLLVLSFNPNPDETIIKNITEIRGYLNPISQILIIDNCSEENFYKIEKDYIKIEKEIKYLVSKELKDLDLNNEVEKIIKKLFSANLSTSLQYKKMSKGFSGSAVLYVRPVGHSHSQVRYVIKIGNSPNSIAKIQAEINNFNTYVDSYSTSYTIKVEETEQCIAIRYTYASKDGKIDAESFSELFKKVEDLNPIIKALFDSALLSEWKQTKSIETITFAKDYSTYINRDELIKAIALIQDISFEEVEQSLLLKIFERICVYKLDSYKKVCHGDLHSENFFVDDENNVLLIDFGDTDFRHSLIDFTTLECSIKFKHIPDYIENGELFEIEKELLELDSFKPGFAFRNINRTDLKKPYKLVSTIRSEAYNSSMIKNNGNQLEYLYSLFMITVRQIRYPTINQLYAIKSAELVGLKILSLIGQSFEDEKTDLSKL